MTDMKRILRAMMGGMLLAGTLAGAETRDLPPAPRTAAPPQWKTPVQWRALQPLENLPRGEWWRIYDDPVLHGLMRSVGSGNQQLRQAVAKFDQARAVARVARSRFFPEANLTPSALYQRTSENMASPFPLLGLSYEGWNLNVPVDFSYEIDLWGRVRKQFAGAQAEAGASAAAMESVLLSVQAEAAQNYFRMRALEQEEGALERVVAAWREELAIVRARVKAGTGSELDEQQAMAELEAAAVQATGLASEREQLENALAVLVGEAAPSFRLEAAKRLPDVPSVPPGVPSDLLERRPDIARAERALAAAAAKVGVASMALYPSVRIAGNAGFMGTGFGNVFDGISRAWSFGPSISLPLFAGGRNRANLEQARAAHDEALAAYRQSVLIAFAEVESQLVVLRRLSEQQAAQGRAVAHAQRAAEIAAARHKAGTSPYVDVLVANRTVLALERSGQQLAGQRLIASVALVKALGGGWQQSLPVAIPSQPPDPDAIPAEKSKLRRWFQRERK
jgi:multidrug efflux system outer membrane protein